MEIVRYSAIHCLKFVGFIQGFEHDLSFIQHVHCWDATVHYLIEYMALHVHISR